MENALAIVDKARTSGALVYAASHLETGQLYLSEAKVINARADEFTDIGGGKNMPAKAVVDRVADAAGIDFLPTAEAVISEVRDDEELGRRTVSIGRCQGRVRLSDGSWRHSAPEEYEFDPYVRARIDSRGDVQKEKRLRVEYQKFQRQRAATGARLRVIRSLTGMPTAFTNPEVQTIVNKGAVFTRIVQNTDALLASPEGRAMAFAQATGAVGALFGPQAQARDVTEPRRAPDALPAPAAEVRDVTPAAKEEEDPFAPAEDGDPGLPPAVVEARTALMDWANHENPAIRERAEAILGRDERDPEVLAVSLELLKYLGAKCLREAGFTACVEALKNTPTDLIVLRDIAGKAKGAYEARVKKAS